MIDIFKGRKDEIKSKLHDGNPNQEEIRLTSTKKPKAGKNDDNAWISLIKTELTERSTSPSRSSSKTIAKPPLRSPFLQESAASTSSDDKKIRFQFVQHQRKKSDGGDSEPLRTREGGEAAGAVPRCVRCSQQVATVDRILIAGFLLHRSCLTCSRCGVTLRLSEVRDGAGDDVCNFNYLCILCSKNRANNSTRVADRMTTSLDGSLLVTRPPPAPVSPKQQQRQSLADRAAASSFAATDEYELRLRERMKWKEQFLLNNNNIDLGSLVRRQALNVTTADSTESASSADDKRETERRCSSDSPDGPVTAGDQEVSSAASAAAPSPAVVVEGSDTSPSSTCARRAINERIEYENVSTSFELFDDDELTKMLNLDSGDNWESG